MPISPIVVPPIRWEDAFPFDQAAFLGWVVTDLSPAECRALADEFAAVGIDAADGADWFRAGFSAADAALWIAAGFVQEDSGAAAGFRDLGLTPEEGHRIEYG